MMHSLPIFVKLHGRKVILVGTGEAADAKARLIERAGGQIVTDEDAGGAALAYVALDDEEEAKAAVRRLKSRGLLVNAVDRPYLCDFTTPAIVDRSPVLIAIATGGASAGLAKALRQRIEGLIPSAAGVLAEKLKQMRENMKQRWPDASDRRRAIDGALAQRGMLDPFADHEASLDDRMDAWLNGEQNSYQRYIEKIVLSSLEADDLTLKTARILGEADHIVHPKNCPSALLERARADAARHIAPADLELLDGLIVCLEYDEELKTDH